MIYNSLESIPLKRFIDVYNGNTQSLIINGNHSEIELRKAAKELIDEYTSIIGGKEVKGEVIKKIEISKRSYFIDFLKLCKEMLSAGMIDDVSEVMKNAGYKIDGNNPDLALSRINSLLASSEMSIDQLISSQSAKKPKKQDKDWFAKEFVSVMTHYKMQPNKETITAKEYAYMVRNMCDEIEAISCSMKKKK